MGLLLKSQYTLYNGRCKGRKPTALDYCFCKFPQEILSRPPPSRRCLPTTVTGTTSGVLQPCVICTAAERPELDPSQRCTEVANAVEPSLPISASPQSLSPAKFSNPSKRWDSWNLVK